MSGRVLLAEHRPGARREALQLGGHYRLPSGAVVVLDRLSRNGVADCHYWQNAVGTRVGRDQDVSFEAAWLERYGQLNWGG